MRRYSNPADSAWGALTILEIKVREKEVEAVRTAATFSFSTRFGDGKLLTTRNMSTKALTDNSPDRIIQECRQTTDIDALKRQHDARASQLGVPIAPVTDVKRIFDEQCRDHQRLYEYQAERGLCRLVPGGIAYELTDKTYIRGIWSHFNPFARRVSWLRLIFSAVVGGGLPLLAVLLVVPAILSGPGASDSLASFLPITLIVAVAYALGGVLVGLLSDWGPFYWIMLISYIPTHSLARWSFGPFPFSTLMFVVAFSTRQALRRRKLLFDSTASHPRTSSSFLSPCALAHWR